MKFENQLKINNQRYLEIKMKTVSINVYSYPELSEKAKQKAYYRWLETEPEDWIIYDFRETLEILEDCGVKLTKWQFDESNYWFILDTSSDLAPEIEITELKGLTALKKAMHLYAEIAIGPRIFRNPEFGLCKYRESKVLFHNEGVSSWSIDYFYVALKELINKKDLSLSLYDYLSAGMDNLFKIFQQSYADQLSEEAFKIESEDRGLFYFENGSLYGCV
jgi:hypothetical protein